MHCRRPGREKSKEKVNWRAELSNRNIKHPIENNDDDECSYNWNKVEQKRYPSNKWEGIHRKRGRNRNVLNNCNCNRNLFKIIK